MTKYLLTFDIGYCVVVSTQNEDELQGIKEDIAIRHEEKTGDKIRCIKIKKIEE